MPTHNPTNDNINAQNSTKKDNNNQKYRHRHIITQGACQGKSLTNIYINCERNGCNLTTNNIWNHTRTGIIKIYQQKGNRLR